MPRSKASRPTLRVCYRNEDLDLLTRDDLDYFFDGVQCPPTFHYDLESFYAPEEIEACQESSMEKNGARAGNARRVYFEKCWSYPKE